MALKYSVAVVLLFTTLAISSVRSELCIRGDSSKGCYSTDDWRNNIICRIEGGFGGDYDGYENDTIIGKKDSNKQKYLKLRSLNGLTEIKSILSENINEASQEDQVAMLRAAEQSLMRLGRLLYGASGWTHNRCAIVDANGKQISESVRCGDRTFNPPNCPLVPSEGAPRNPAPIQPSNPGNPPSPGNWNQPSDPGMPPANPAAPSNPDYWNRPSYPPGNPPSPVGWNGPSNPRMPTSYPTAPSNPAYWYPPSNPANP